MPELPEVETIRRGLSELLLTKVITAIHAEQSKNFPNSPQDVSEFAIGASIVAIRRRAKVLIIDLSTAYSFVVHLKMTGQLVHRGEQNFGAGHPSDSLVGSLPDKTTRVTVIFEDGSKLYFNDQRKFGWMRLLPTAMIPEIDFMKKLGPEPLEKSFTPLIFKDRVKKRNNATIKATLLDQTVIAGVGNIYADESLWGAKIHPAAKVSELTDAQICKLHNELQFVLRLAIEKGGSTDKNFVNAEGKKGSYINFARVFRRENQDCPRCGTVIIKTKVAGRGTHTCPVCQKLRK